METTEKHLHQRFDRLERQNRRLRIVAGLAMALAALPFISGMAQDGESASNTSGTKEVTASKFIVADDAGKPRLVLEMKPNGPRISMFDSKEKTRASLQVTDFGPSFMLYDADQEPRLGSMVLPDGPKIVMWTRDEQMMWAAP